MIDKGTMNIRLLFGIRLIQLIFYRSAYYRILYHTFRSNTDTYKQEEDIRKTGNYHVSFLNDEHTLQVSRK